jgi:hypothetical protein
VAESTAGGFPAISAPIGQFLLKDLVLLAASFVLLRTAAQIGNRDDASMQYSIFLAERLAKSTARRYIF